MRWPFPSLRSIPNKSGENPYENLPSDKSDNSVPLRLQRMLNGAYGFCLPTLRIRMTALQG
jgi:hypothetical protein